MASRVLSGRHGSRLLSVRADVVSRHIPALVVGFLLVMTAATVVVGFAAAADGADHPATFASVVVAVAVGAGGPTMMAGFGAEGVPAHARDRARFDEIIHPSTRLSIVALLASADWIDFAFVRDRLDLSDSALSKQFSTLERAGYVAVERPTTGRRRRVQVRLTGEGRRAFEGHVAARGLSSPPPIPRCRCERRRGPTYRSSARRAEKPGLIWPSMMRRRWSNGQNADFMALIVSHSISSQPKPKASTRGELSVMSMPDISRLSVFTVTRNRSRVSRPMGCSAIDGAAPVCTLDVGHISSGTRRSRTNAASRPSWTRPSVVERDVVDDADAVAEPLGAAQLQRLPDRRQAERLAGVDRDVAVGLGDLRNASR